MVGWGEGLDIVTDYLNEKPDAERLTVAGFYPRVMSAQFKGTVLSDKQYDAAMADYIVLYVNAVQRDLANRLRMVTRGKRTEMVVKINGIEYARLYAGAAAAAPERRRHRVRGPASGSSGTFLKSDERPLPEVRRPQPRRHDRGDDPLVRRSGRSTKTCSAVVQMVDRKGASSPSMPSPIGGPDSRLSTMRRTTSPSSAPDRAAERDRASTTSRRDRRPNGEWLEITSFPERLGRGGPQLVAWSPSTASTPSSGVR